MSDRWFIGYAVLTGNRPEGMCVALEPKFRSNVKLVCPSRPPESPRSAEKTTRTMPIQYTIHTRACIRISFRTNSWSSEELKEGGHRALGRTVAELASTHLRSGSTLSRAVVHRRPRLLDATPNQPRILKSFT